MGVFGKIKPAIAQPGCIEPDGVRDLFLYALFARLALSDGSNVEFETKFNPSTNTIELQLPDCAIPFFDKVTGMKQGPRFRQYINWLVGNTEGGSGLIIADLDVTGSLASTATQTLASVVIPGNTMADGTGIRIKAFGSVGANNAIKTIKLLFGATTIATNDLSKRPNGLNWMVNAEIFNRSGTQECIGWGLFGGVSQTVQNVQTTEDITDDIAVKLTAKSSLPIADSIVCRGLYVERI
ncbi:MAG: hypothetical protein QXU32_01880 [Nitrososphaerales archaeon]